MQFLSSRVSKVARNPLFFTRSSHRISLPSPIAMASLKVSLEQNIRCEDVVKIAEKAAEAIIAVYNSKVSNNSMDVNRISSQLPIKLTNFLFVLIAFSGRGLECRAQGWWLTAHSRWSRSQRCHLCWSGGHRSPYSNSFWRKQSSQLWNSQGKLV